MAALPPMFAGGASANTVPSEHRGSMEETRIQLGPVPDTDKVLPVDLVAGVVASASAALETASPAQVKILVKMLVQRVTTPRSSRRVRRAHTGRTPVLWAAGRCMVRPRTVLEERRSHDALAWYADAVA
jgi:hypothetical protein